MDSVTVLTLADEAYAMPLAVMVRSLLDHLAPGIAVRLVIIDGGITPATRQRLNDSWRDSAAWGRCQVEFAAPCFPEAPDLPLWGRMSVLTYARLSADQYITPKSGKAILLDSDTLILTDIGQLAATDLGDAIIAATQDPFIPFVSSVGALRDYAALGLKPEVKYFNAGVMVIEIGRWHAERVGPKAFSYLRAHRANLQQYDQDALNAVLADRWKELDPRWQAHPRTANSLGLRTPENPCIVHFSGRLKPWSYPARQVADDLFYQFVERTAWSGFRPPRTLTSWGLALYDSPLRRLIYPLEKRVMALRNRLSMR